MIVPFEKLSPEALRNIAMEFVTREGTDYGHAEISMDDKVAQVIADIRAGKVFVAYDHVTESCNLLTEREARALASDD